MLNHCFRDRISNAISSTFFPTSPVNSQFSDNNSIDIEDEELTHLLMLNTKENIFVEELKEVKEKSIYKTPKCERKVF
jgi:hypothetical protein